MIEPTIIATLGNHKIEEFTQELSGLGLGARIRIDGRPFWGTFGDAVDAVAAMIKEEEQ